jgi:hypothetical protein
MTSVGQSDATDIERLRVFARDIAGCSDEELQAAIDGAKAWIRGRRWSWLVVASNYLRDGEFHASLRGQSDG